MAFHPTAPIGRSRTAIAETPPLTGRRLPPPCDTPKRCFSKTLSYRDVVKIEIKPQQPFHDFWDKSSYRICNLANVFPEPGRTAFIGALQL
jgi:hypothetical protein